MELLPVLRALADPNRLRIVQMLREREQCVCHLLERLELTQGTVSHHMAVLKRAGLVRDRRDDSDARWVYYSLTPEAKQWGQRLADLLNNDRVDPVPADCAGRTDLPRGSKTTCPHPEFIT
jgi:ArsR family transcriptional regulator